MNKRYYALQGEFDGILEVGKNSTSLEQIKDCLIEDFSNGPRAWDSWWARILFSDKVETKEEFVKRLNQLSLHSLLLLAELNIVSQTKKFE